MTKIDGYKIYDTQFNHFKLLALQSGYGYHIFMENISLLFNSFLLN
mgnify:CR=1 FL=1